MAIDIKKHMLPLAVTGGALALAVVVGLVPVLSSSGDGDPALYPADAVAALEARIAALESAGPAEAGTSELDPRLRQEIDLIVKGLVNQTGRISGLKAQLEPVTAWLDAYGGPTRLDQDLALINKALLNQTRRVSGLKAELAAVNAWSAAGGPDRLAQELALINKALLNQTARISALAERTKDLPKTEAAVDRLALQVSNLERAVGNLHRRQALSDRTAAAEAPRTSEMDIEAKLDAILNALAER